jgi:hypothetical protein
MKETYKEDATFWNRLIDAAADASDIVIRIEQLQEADILGGERRVALREKAEAIMNVVTTFKDYARQASTSPDEIYTLLSRTRRTDPDTTTRAIAMRRSIHSLRSRELPQIVSILEQLEGS